MTMEPILYFKALGDETRLRLLNLLREQELNVNEIVTILEMGQSRISRHLKILNESGLLQSRRDGLWVFYRAAEGGEGSQLLGCLGPFLDEEENRDTDRERLRRLMSEGAARKAEYFDAIAPDWEDIRADILGDFRAAPEVIPMLTGKNTIADLGCGTGELLASLQQKGRHCIGVDRSPRMLDLAGERLKGGGADLRIGGIEHLPIREGEIDGAVINMVLHHLNDPKSALGEVARVISSGGSLVIVDLARHGNEELRQRYGHRWLGFDENDLAVMLADAGFIVKEQKEFSVKQGLRVVVCHGVRK